MSYYTKEQLQNLAAMIKPVPFLVPGYIPAQSRIILLHGPGGVGKSTVLWALASALETGTPWLGMTVVQTKTLFICVDMNVYDLQNRWGEHYKPDFGMEIDEPQEICDDDFLGSEFALRCQERWREDHVGLVLIDTIGKLCRHDFRERTTCTKVYAKLIEWFPATTIIINAHNSKAKRDDMGYEVINDDDYLGSQAWRDDAVIALHMRKVNGADFKSRIYTTKNQVAAKPEKPLDVYIDQYGRAELWDDKRAHQVVTQWQTIAKDPTPIEAYMSAFGVSRATAFRVQKMYRDRHKILDLSQKT